MKKKIITVLLAILCLLILVSCGQEQETELVSVINSPTVEPTTAKPTNSPTTIPTTTPKTTTTIRSYTSGLPILDQTNYKPVGVIIENNSAARPQSGIQAADIVYEAPVEGCTRFFCIYNDNMPEYIGPVRSARLYFIRFQQEWDCAFVHFGGPSSGKSNVYLDSSNHIDVRIDLIKGSYNDYYWRIDDRSAPHNAYTSALKCQQLIDEEATIHTFNYADENTYTGQKISSVTLPFYSGEVTYKYDETTDLLLRYMDNKEFTDAETKSIISIKNLIVQYNHFYHGNETKGRWLCDHIGEGKADYFINGVHIKGTWEKESFESPTIYKDVNGNEIILLPGNTWIAVHPDSEDISVKYN